MKQYLEVTKKQLLFVKELLTHLTWDREPAVVVWTWNNAHLVTFFITDGGGANEVWLEIRVSGVTWNESLDDLLGDFPSVLDRFNTLPLMRENTGEQADDPPCEDAVNAMMREGHSLFEK